MKNLTKSEITVNLLELKENETKIIELNPITIEVYPCRRIKPNYKFSFLATKLQATELPNGRSKVCVLGYGCNNEITLCYDSFSSKDKKRIIENFKKCLVHKKI